MPSNCYRSKKVCILIIVCIALSAVVVAILVLAIYNNQPDGKHLLVGQIKAGVTDVIRCQAEGKNVTNGSNLRLQSPSFTMVCEATTKSRGTEHSATPLSPCFDLTTSRGQHDEQTCSYKKKKASLWECTMNFTTQLQREATRFILIECNSGTPQFEFTVEIMDTTTAKTATTPQVTSVPLKRVTSSEEPHPQPPAPKSRSCNTSGQMAVIILSTILTKIF